MTIGIGYKMSKYLKNVRCPKHNGTIVFGRSSEADEFPKEIEKDRKRSKKIEKFEKTINFCHMWMTS